MWKPRRSSFKLILILIFLVVLITVLGSEALPATAQTRPSRSPSVPRSEIRGTWITNVDSAVLFDQASLNSAMQELAELNFNTVYPTVWNWGYTQYPSKIMEEMIDAAYDPRPVGLKRDFLAEMVESGHRSKLAVIPWFEFGFMVPEDSAMAIRHGDWLTQKRDGTITWQEGIYPRVWLNPFRPEVQKFIQDLVLEIVTQYDIDGIQFDDHFGLPFEFGYDDYTVALYRKEHSGKAPPSNPKDSEWVRWRANKITEFTTRLFRAVKARKEHVLFTLSPNNYAFSLNHSLQDWLTWERQGLLEELVLQAYRDDLSSFMGEINAPEFREARNHIPTAVGILTGLKRKTVPLRQIQQQVQAIRQQGYPGISFFFYETMWNLSGEAKAGRKAGFQRLFSTPVDRPNLKRGWTPQV
jgi:uncharacterized lipoprotein YddW (UPF0748 family)